jgi:acetoacetyl-CoA reductase
VNERRVAIVTGGTRGIGAAITKELARQGVHVVAGYVDNDEAADLLRSELLDEDLCVSLFRGTVTCPDLCRRVVDTVMEQEGQIDYLVNNAGINADHTVRKMSLDEWHAVLDVNLTGAFYMTKVVLDHMVARGSGRIVYISSVIGETGNVGQANYAAAKAALFGLTKSLALETAPRGITVNCLAPGFVETDMVAAMPEAARDAVIERIPARRMAEPEEIAHAVQFLLDDRSSYITGSVLSINGGVDM